MTSSTGLTLMPECRCRTEDGTAGKSANAGLTFSGSPVLPHLHLIFQHHTALITPEAAVYGRSGFITITTFSLQCGCVGCTFFINAGMSGCPASNQSGTRIRGPSPVPESFGTGLRYRMPECRAGGIGLDADAKLW